MPDHDAPSMPATGTTAAILRDLVRKATTVKTGRGREGRAYVRCGCGHKCYGKFFGSVESGAKGDAWMAFRRHFERAHGKYPFTREGARRVR